MKRISQWICVAASLFLAAVVCAGATPATPAPVPAATPAGIEFFETKIRPVLVEQCYRCHSAKAEKLKAKLLLDTRDGILKGGESDNPGIVPGNLDDSTLIRAIRWEDEGLQMPPKKKLPADQIASFETWVKMGAPMPPTAQGAKPAALAVGPATQPAPLHGLSLSEGRKFWSFIPPREQPVPVTTKPDWARNDVEKFILAKLEEKQTAPSPPADKRTLLR